MYFSGLKYQLKQIRKRPWSHFRRIFLCYYKKMYWNDRRDSLTFRWLNSILYNRLDKWICIKSLNWDNGEQKSPVKIFCKYWPDFSIFKGSLTVKLWPAFTDERKFQNLSNSRVDLENEPIKIELRIEFYQIGIDQIFLF